MSLFTLKSKILIFPYWNSIKTGFSKMNKGDITSLAKLKEPPLKDNKDVFHIKEELPKVRPFEIQFIIDENSKIQKVNGVPPEHVKPRKVRIYMPTKNAMQSGTNNIQQWEIEFDTRERWENPLMGWTSTGDPFSNTKLPFPTKEEAIDFCEKNCWEYFVQEKTSKKMKIRPYSDNYSWDKHTRVSTK